jgi:hypothetical protein
MPQDLELEKLKQKKLAEMQASAPAAEPIIDHCMNCSGQCEPDLLTELKPGKHFCPKCVIMAAKAFANSDSFLVQIGSNKKKTFAKIQSYDADTQQFTNQKIIDVSKMPVISIVGNIQFFKAKQMVPKPGNITVKRKGETDRIVK